MLDKGREHRTSVDSNGEVTIQRKFKDSFKRGEKAESSGGAP